MFGGGNIKKLGWSATLAYVDLFSISCCHVTLTSDHQAHKRRLMEIHLGFEDIMMQIPFVNFPLPLAPCCGLQAQPLIHETLHQGK